MSKEARMFEPPFAELVDRLTIDQIKDVFFQDGKSAIQDEMQRIQHDLDLIIRQKSIPLDSALIRAVVAIAQINLHIWNNKDQMERCRESDQEKYLALLKLSHQLNGVRNQLKNRLLALSDEKDAASARSNFKTDGLSGWDLNF